MDSIFGGGEKGPFDVGAEGFGTVFGDAVCARGAEEGEDLFIASAIIPMELSTAWYQTYLVINLTLLTRHSRKIRRNPRLHQTPIHQPQRLPITR